MLIAASGTAQAAETIFNPIPPKYVAGAVPSSCTLDSLCVWENRDFAGTPRIRDVVEDRDWSDNYYANGHNLNDSASSIYNSSTDHTRQVYRDTGLRGHVLCLEPLTGVTDLSHVQWSEVYSSDPHGSYVGNFSMNDRLSSHYTNQDPIDHLKCDWIAKTNEPPNPNLPDKLEDLIPPIVQHPPSP